MLKKYRYIFIISLLAMILLAYLTYRFMMPRIYVEKDDITIKLNEEYVEPDYYAYMGFMNIKDKVRIDGIVDNTHVGDYKITYYYKTKLFDVNKTINVKVVDEILPSLELVGEENINVCSIESYKEEGYTASDNYDGDLTDKVVVENKDNIITYSVSDSSGNKVEKSRKLNVVDEIGPKLSLSGLNEMYLQVGTIFTEPGYSASDNCDGDITSKVKVNGSVDYNTIGSYQIDYKVSDSNNNTSTATRKVNVVSEEDFKKVNSGIIYLTFDDGPSTLTPQILDILAKYNIKATFFVTMSGSDDMIKREYMEGHTIALHTATHVYKTIYASVDAYFNDLNTVSNRVKNITGIETKYVRFPGGSSNEVSYNRKTGAGVCMSVLTKELEARGYKYFDWNVSIEDNGSCSSKKDKRSCMLNNYTTYLKKNKGNVVLMHDIKSYTADNLEEMIIYGINNGFTFKQIDDSAPTAHHGTKC